MAAATTKKVLLLFGPTAVGKTAIAIQLAKELDGEIISADSMQVYKGMDIGTAKPSLKERQGIPHHLIDILDPNQDFSVSEFLKSAKAAIDEISARGKLPIVVGGTGLYLKALIEGYTTPPKSDPEIRQRLELKAKEQGILHLYARLKKIDPKAAENIHWNNKKRVIRALEVYELTGQPFSQLQKKETLPGYELVRVCLNMDREKLYERIEQRADKMIEDGLIEEARKMLDVGRGTSKTAMQALGYKEVAEYLRGKYSKNEMIELIKKSTRHFARRQLIWFRKFKNVQWIDADKVSPQDLSKEIRVLLNAP